ncbi:MAG: methyltransferase domain-containing protein [Patescibacteria group bacterium]
MQHPTVEKLFKEQAKYYSRIDQSAANSPIISLLVKWAEKKNPKNLLKICEFGGGGGLLLSEIKKLAKFKVELSNIELINAYKKYQVSSDIKFYQGSILSSKFPDQSFDCLIIRDVLHHLIGENFSKTRKNQETALKELKRLVRPGGAIFIEELVNQSGFASKIIYLLSKLNSKIGVRIQRLEITPNTVVCFLSPKILKNLINSIFGSKKILKEVYLPAKHWQARVVHLGCGSGKLVLMIKG